MPSLNISITKYSGTPTTFTDCDERNKMSTIIVWSLEDEIRKRPDGVTVREFTTPM